MTRAARALKPEAVVWRGDPLLPACPTRGEGLGHSHWEARVRAGVSGATTSALPTHPLGQRHPICVSPLVHVWRHQGKLLVACSQTRRRRRFRQMTGRECLGVPPRDLGHSTCVSGSGCLLRLVIVSGRFGIGQRSSCSSRCTLGQLGRFPANGQTEDRKVDDLTVGRLMTLFRVSMPLTQCQRVLMDAGLAVPPWDELAETPPRREEEPEPSQPKMGWQQRASRKLEAKFIHDSVWPALDDSARALILHSVALWRQHR